MHVKHLKYYIIKKIFLFPDVSQSLVAIEPWLAKDPRQLSVYARMHALVQGTHG